MKNIYCEKCEKIYSIPEDKVEFFMVNERCYFCRKKVEEEILIHPGEGNFVFPSSTEDDTIMEVSMYEN